ncbi:hypothetical protein EDB86DRAFT_2829988 [Lactarius hatsudake]|nr:hypothetical protein EDB86DRAFT_2829988 [Lactarius hatsudake]
MYLSTGPQRQYTRGRELSRSATWRREPELTQTRHDESEGRYRDTVGRIAGNEVDDLGWRWCGLKGTEVIGFESRGPEVHPGELALRKTTEGRAQNMWSTLNNLSGQRRGSGSEMPPKTVRRGCAPSVKKLDIKSDHEGGGKGCTAHIDRCRHHVAAEFPTSSPRRTTDAVGVVTIGIRRIESEQYDFKEKGLYGDAAPSARPTKAEARRLLVVHPTTQQAARCAKTIPLDILLDILLLAGEPSLGLKTDDPNSDGVALLAIAAVVASTESIWSDPEHSTMIPAPDQITNLPSPYTLSVTMLVMAVKLLRHVAFGDSAELWAVGVRVAYSAPFQLSPGTRAVWGNHHLIREQEATAAAILGRSMLGGWNGRRSAEMSGVGFVMLCDPVQAPAQAQRRGAGQGVTDFEIDAMLGKG